MIADIFYPIFNLTITVLACFIRKKAKLFRDLHTRVFQGTALDPLGGLELPPDPQLQSFLAMPRIDTPIFFLYYPLICYLIINKMFNNRSVFDVCCH